MGNSSLSTSSKVYAEDPNVQMVQTWIYNCDWKNIAIFIDNEPLYVTMKDDKGRLPLHNAFVKKAPEFIVDKLIKHDPGSLQTPDYDDLFPIHYAIISGYPSSFLIKLLTNFPDILRIQDKDGKNIFHYSLMFGGKLDLIKYLADLPPQTLAYTGISSLNLTSGALTQGFVESRVRTGKLGIHFAIENRASFEVIELLLSRYPAAASEYFDGKSPLHLACEKRCPYNVIQLVLRTFPEAATHRATAGMMALHIAAANKADPDTINLLLSAFPNACLERDRTLRNPLHWALENSLCDESIFAIIFAAPDAAKVKGHGGKIALHVAIDRGYKYNVIKELLNSNPQAAKETDSFNVLPLKLAISKLNCPDTVIDIINAYPKACSVPDEFGRVAFHYGVSRKFPNNVLQAIYEAAPETVNSIDQNNQLPLHLAIKRVPELEMIRLLLGTSKESVMIMDRYGYLPIHYAMEGDATEDMVKLMIKADPRCLTVKCKGKLALHFACEFKKSTAMIKLLIAGYKDATLVKEDGEGRIPLCWAISRRLPIQSLLAIEAANHDEIAFIEDHEGHLPIHYCLKYGSHHELTRVLLTSNSKIAVELNFPRHVYTQEEIASINESYEKEEKPSQQELDLREISGGYKGMYHFGSEIVLYGRSKRVHSGRLLIHYAVENLKAHPNSVAEVMMYTMPISHIDGRPNPEHKFTWTYLLSETNDKYWEAIDIILKRYEHIKGAIKYLCDIPSEQGYKAVNICTPECQKQLLRRLYYFGRYELMHGPYLHTSLNSLVILALDHEDDKRMVCLKFMKYRQQFDREVNLRANISLSSDFVLPVLHSHDGESDPTYKDETVLKGFQDFPFCIVMVAAERDLSSIIVHEHFAGRNWDLIRNLAIDILHCMKHLHDKGLIHGEIKPMSVVRENGGKLKLIDLGSAVSYWKQEFAGGFKSSSAYIPPEMVQMESSVLPNFKRERPPFDVTEDMGGAIDSSIRISKMTGLPLPVHSTYNECILADPSIDMWSFGALFYQMCSSTPLLEHNCFDEVDTKTLNTLRDWTHSFKWRKLGKVSNSLAKNVLDQLLAKEPRRRPTVDYILKHPFFTQKPAYRFPAMDAVSDIYISYRGAERKNTWHAKHKVSWDKIKENSLGNFGSFSDEDFYKLSEDQPTKVKVVPLISDDERNHYVLEQLLLSYGFIVSSSVGVGKKDQKVSIQPFEDKFAAMSAFEKAQYNENKSNLIDSSTNKNNNNNNGANVGLNSTLNTSTNDDDDDDDDFHSKLGSFVIQESKYISNNNNGSPNKDKHKEEEGGEEKKVNIDSVMNDSRAVHGSGRIALASEVGKGVSSKGNNAYNLSDDAHRHNSKNTLSDNNLHNPYPGSRVTLDKVINSGSSSSNSSSSNEPIEEDHYIRSAINMIQSRCAVFMLSRYAINDMLDGSSLEDIRPNSLAHQMLFEMRFALELREMGLLECGIMCVCVGDLEFNMKKEGCEVKSHQFIESDNVDTDNSHYGLYFSSHHGEVLGRMGACHPKIHCKKPIASIEEKLREVLDFFHMGKPVEESKGACQIVSDIISTDSYFVSGAGHVAWPNVAEDLFTLLQSDTMFKRSSRGHAVSRPSTSSAGYDLLPSESKQQYLSPSPSVSMSMSMSMSMSQQSLSQYSRDDLHTRSPSKSKSLPPTPGAQTRFKNFTARNREASMVFKYDPHETVTLTAVGDNSNGNGDGDGDGNEAGGAGGAGGGTYGAPAAALKDIGKRTEEDIDGESHIVQMLKIKVLKKEEENANLATEVDILRRQIAMQAQDLNRLRYLNGELVPFPQ